MNNWQSVRLFGLPAEKGRWFLIPLGSVILLCLGTVYSWSIFRKPLEDLFGISATQSLLLFTFLLVFYALFMPVTGFYIDKISVGKITAMGGVVTGIGYILSSLTTNIILVTITYGVIAGVGVVSFIAQSLT